MPKFHAKVQVNRSLMALPRITGQPEGRRGRCGVSLLPPYGACLAFSPKGTSFGARVRIYAQLQIATPASSGPSPKMPTSPQRLLESTEEHASQIPAALPAIVAGTPAPRQRNSYIQPERCFFGCGAERQLKK